MDNFQIIQELLDEEEVAAQDRIQLAAVGAQTILSNIPLRRRRRSMSNHRIINRNRQEGHERLYEDYFSDNPTYGEKYFRRRFRMRRSLFIHIQNAIENFDPYFVQGPDAVGMLGLSSLQKITAALRLLTYGASADNVDDYVRIAETTAIDSLRRFVNGIVEVFVPTYLRRPNEDDLDRLMVVANRRGFPSMLGSIDCIHWRWKNCPTAWHGMYTGHPREPTIILEVVASYDLWIWHAFFGLPGSLNDINVLDRSILFHELAEGRGPRVQYTINDNEYTLGYYLADGIYPSWPSFMKTISSPRGRKRKQFSQTQVSARKDVERAFGVLRARFAIVRGPSRFWDIPTLRNIMLACIIMHNMIIEDERDIVGNNFDFNYDFVEEIPTITPSTEHTNDLMAFIQVH